MSAKAPAESTPSSAEPAEELVQDWLQRLRVHLPEGATIVATVHPDGHGLFLVSFRANVGAEAFISEAREPSASLAVEAAASRLVERLSASPPAEEPPTLASRLRELFGEAG